MNRQASPSEWITGQGTLLIAGTRVEVEVTVPAQPVRATQMLPVLQQLTDTIVNVGSNRAEAAGARISCTKGCGACCRQLVPIAESEAYHLQRVVASLPELQRARVQARFAQAKEQLEQIGLWETLFSPGELTTEQRRQLGLAYFQQGIACPFLEDESCGIHPDRPLACREYLVTSPPENCAAPSAETVHCVELPGSVSRIVQTLTATRGGNWLPLILALDWAEAHPDESPARSGPEWLQAVFQKLTQ